MKKFLYLKLFFRGLYFFITYWLKNKGPSKAFVLTMFYSDRILHVKEQNNFQSKKTSLRVRTDLNDDAGFFYTYYKSLDGLVLLSLQNTNYIIKISWFDFFVYVMNLDYWMNEFPDLTKGIYACYKGLLDKGSDFIIYPIYLTTKEKKEWIENDEKDYSIRRY